MQPMDKQSGEQCRYWGEQGNTCQATGNGLFLPTVEHVKSYCSTLHHCACPHYTQLLSIGEGAPIPGSHENRRVHSRVRGCYSFRFSEMEKNGILEKRNNTDATCTVDVSPGGLRYESYRAFAKETVVGFSLEDDRLDGSFQGQGIVKWCIRLEHSPLFHVGIAFTDKRLPPTIKSLFKRSVVEERLV